MCIHRSPHRRRRRRVYMCTFGRQRQRWRMDDRATALNLSLREPIKSVLLENDMKLNASCNCTTHHCIATIRFASFASARTQLSSLSVLHAVSYVHDTKNFFLIKTKFSINYNSFPHFIFLTSKNWLFPFAALVVVVVDARIFFKFFFCLHIPAGGCSKDGWGASKRVLLLPCEMFCVLCAPQTTLIV